MKIFLSYGHDDNEAIVLRILKVLQDGGHDVWFDQHAIRGGNDWRRAIQAGLAGVDWVVSILSRRTVRVPGVCRDELAIAMAMYGGGITPVLVEPKQLVDAPHSVSHLNWIDLSEWAARQGGDAGEYEAWLKPRLQQILDVPNDAENTRFADDMRGLRGLLKPEPQLADIPVLTEGFVGREWLRDRLHEWRTKPDRDALFWLSADPGVGKSAFAAWFASTQPKHVVALNLCRHGRPERNEPARVLPTLAFLLATRLPEYRVALLDDLQKNDPDGTARAGLSPAGLFGRLLTQHLGAIDGGRSHDPFMVIVDGLDETEVAGRSALAELLARQWRDLPSWLALVVTGRPHDALAKDLAQYSSLHLGAEAQSEDDLRLYVRGWLGQTDPALVEKVATAADGSFAYLRTLRRGVAIDKIDLHATLPPGLKALYKEWFERQFSQSGAYDGIRGVIGVLLAASRPVPPDLLAEVFQWRGRTKVVIRETLNGLFDWDDGVAPFHSSLREWLTDEGKDGPGSVFLLDPQDISAGPGALRAALWRRFVAAADVPGARPDGFNQAELPGLLLDRDATDLRADMAASPWRPIVGLAQAIAEERQAARDWGGASVWWKLTTRLAEAAGAEASWSQHYAHVMRGDVAVLIGNSANALAAFRASQDIMLAWSEGSPNDLAVLRDLSVSHNRIGDVLVSQGDGAGALAAFRAGMAIAERLAASDPGNAGWQRDLSVSHNMIGDVLVSQGDGAGALAAFRADMAIAERLAASDPGNAGWQRDLSVSHNRIGDVLVSQGDGAGALAAFRAGMAIAERLAASDPGNAGWQRDLSVSHDRIGDVLVSQGDGAGALAAFRAGMAIRELLAASDPGNAEWQRDLSVSHNKIGDVLVSQGDGAGALAAFRAGMAIAERLAASDPGNAGWQRDLSVSHNKIGNVLVSQGDGAGALAAFRAGMAIAERLAASDPGNAGWQRDLSVSHDRIGDVLVSQGDGAGALAAFRAGMAIRERLAASDPGNAGWQRDLSVSHNKIGGVLVSQGDGAGALAAFRADMAIAEWLAASDPGNAGWQRDVAISLGRVASALLTLNETAQARDMAERAIVQMRRCVEQFPQVQAFTREMPYYEGLLRRASGVP